MKKRAISFLLALVMILGFLPNKAFATQEAVRLDMRDPHCNDDYADRAHLGDPFYLNLGMAHSSAYEVSRVDIALPEIVLGQPGPAPSVDADAPYTVQQWMWCEQPSGVPVDTLKLGKTYSLEMSVKLKDGYAFAGEPNVYVNGEFFDNVRGGVDGFHLWISYAVSFIQYIDEVNVLIDEPELGKPLPQATVPEGAPYHVLETRWIDLETGELATEPVSGASYELCVEVASWEGFDFTGSTRLLLNGTDNWDFGVCGHLIATIGKYYPVSSFCEMVNEVHITVPEAVPGEVGPTPVVAPDAPYEIAQAFWYDAVTYEPVEILAANGNYYLEISLEPKAGYAFTDTVDIYFNGEKYDDGWANDTYLRAQYDVSFQTIIDKVELTVTRPFAGDAAGTVTVDGDAPYYLNDKVTEWGASDVDNLDAAKRVVAFESGQYAWVAADLLAKDGYFFSTEVEVYVNGQKLGDSGAIFYDVYELAVVENLGLVTERTPCGSLLGDVNMDGFVDSMDTNILFRYANEDATLGELSAEQLLAADANQDGFVDSMDTNILFRYANEDPTSSWIPMEIQVGKKTDEE